MPLPVALRIAYDGARFAAYARDPAGGTVEDALLAALRHEGYVEESFRTGSRTDAGVSALENVCRAEVDRPHLKGLVPALQRNCPDGLWVTGAAAVEAKWNPRHAKRRAYLHHSVARREDPAALAAAAAAFVGRHHMGAFARMEEGRRPERTVFAFGAEAAPPGWRFTVEGDGFLWNQVRRMVSAVLCVGRGEATVADIQASLRTGKPHRSFRLAAAEGLVLARVEYDPEPAWDPAAGRLGAHGITRTIQDAAARQELARHLQDLAPWPDGREPNSGRPASSLQAG